MNILTPQVGLGGTPRDLLIEQRRHAADRLQQAIAALETMAPHARDWTHRSGRFFEAQKIHATRIARVADLLNQVEHELWEVVEQS